MRSEASPAWSADGGLPQPYGKTFAMRADGTDVRRLTDNKWEDATRSHLSSTMELHLVRRA
jgi:hypothetical protein